MSPYTFATGDSELPVGQSNVEIIEAKDGPTSSNGNPQMIVELEDVQGRQLTDWVVMTERAKWRVQQLWSAAGLDWPETGQVDERDLIGKRVHVEVFEDTYNGVTRRKIKEYSKPIGSDVPMDIEPQQLSGGFGAAVGAGKPADDDDDIPF